MINGPEPHLHETSARFNTNSAVIAFCSIIILGALSWVGNKTSENNDKLNQLSTALPYVADTVRDLKVAVATLVTRSEMESRLGEMKTRDNQIEARLLQVEQQMRFTKP
jgi:hypothetical protein